MSGKTQRERAIAAFVSLHAQAASAVQELEVVLDEAQNDPPHGMRDGTIDPVAYNALRRATFGLKDFVNATAPFVEEPKKVPRT